MTPLNFNNNPNPWKIIFQWMSMLFAQRSGHTRQITPKGWRSGDPMEKNTKRTYHQHVHLKVLSQRLGDLVAGEPKFPPFALASARLTCRCVWGTCKKQNQTLPSFEHVFLSCVSFSNATDTPTTRNRHQHGYAHARANARTHEHAHTHTCVRTRADRL